MFDNFLKWYATSKLASYVRVFLAIVAAQAVLDFNRLGVIDFQNWQTWVIAGLVALVPTASRVANPQDKLSL
jgi:hypothetical protein